VVRPPLITPVRAKILIAVLLLGAALLVLLWDNPALAQQTIFNVPSADITPRGKLYVENEGQFRPWTPHPFYLGTQYDALGLGFNTELDLSMFNITAPSTHNLALAPGFRSCIPLLKERLKERELKLTVGELIPIQLIGDRSVGSWTYVHGSGRLPGINTRITAGVSVGTKQLFGKNVVSFIGGIEQRVTRRFSVQADWFSGSHSLGLFIPGCAYVLPGKAIVFVGFQIPNTNSSGRTGFCIEVSRVNSLIPQ